MFPVMLVMYGLLFTYALFMMIYLNNAKKCDSVLSEQNNRFRKVAYVITWIFLVIYGLWVLVGFIGTLAMSTYIFID